MPHCVRRGDGLALGIGGAEVRSKGGQMLSLQKIPPSLLPNRPLKFSSALPKVLLRQEDSICVCGRVWLAGQKLRFSTSTARLPLWACQAQSAAGTRTSSNADWLSSPALAFSEDADRWNNTPLPLAPAVMQSICLNYRLQQLCACLFCRWKAGYLCFQGRWQEQQ